MSIVYGIFMLISISHASYGQNNDILLWQMNTPINIYTSATGHEVKTVILQSSMDDLWYCAEVIETSELRFKVLVSLYPDISEEFYYSCEGWVDKTQCGVYSDVNIYKDGVGYMYLYPDTTLTDPILYRQNDDDGNLMLPQVLTVLEFALKDGKTLAKVIFTYDDKIVVGWISRFCINPYSTCN
ncbi:MAG: hypothetical protein K2I64_04080 [Muribaculaceae bacterium]|nr:hypothetical protein [Muribaculaceae bacterium]